MLTDNFILRHNGPRPIEVPQMLEKIGVDSFDQLIDETVPPSIRMKEDMDLPEGMNELEYVSHLKEIGSRRKRQPAR